MELNDLIPDNDSIWIIKKNYLMVKKLENIPLSYIKDNVVYVFLDAKIPKYVIKLVKHLININANFYMNSPLCSNPSGIEDYKEEIIKHYLISYVNKDFFYGFKKINFDLIENLSDWIKKEKCFDLIKPIYDDVLKKINRNYYDYFSNSKKYYYISEIRDDFKTIYRDLRMNYALSK